MKFEIETQVSLNLKNEPGQIAEVSEQLSQAGFHIRAITIAESSGDGVMRFTTDNPLATTAYLVDKGYQPKSEQVISIRLQDSKGRLASITRTLAASGINIDYVYASVDSEGSSSRLVLKVSNIPLATRVLSELNQAS